MKLSHIGLYMGFGLLTISLASCHPKAQVKQEEQKPAQPAQNPNAQPPEPSLRGKEYQDVPELAPVFFDLDQSTLRQEARNILQKNAQVLKDHADWEALVEGHCDDRGTTQYNLALGQRRAASVRQYYISLGIDAGRIATISYGKEKPICFEENEDCWSRNRRGATKARSTKTAANSSETSGTPSASDTGTGMPAGSDASVR